MRIKLLAGVAVTVWSVGCGGGGNGTGGGGGTATGGGSGGGGGTMTGGGAAMGGGTMTGGGTGTGGGGSSLPTVDGGEDCATAATLTPGMWSSTTDGLKSSFLFAPAGICWGQDTTGDGAPDSVFKIHLTNGQRMKATVTGADWDAVINLVASPAQCGSPTDAGTIAGITCLAGSDLGVAMDGESVAYTNSTGATQDVLLIVDGYRDIDYGVFEVDLAVDSPDAGDSCIGATALTVGQMVQAQSLAGFTNDYPSIVPVCAFPTTGPDRVYTVDIAAQSKVVVQAQATGMGDVGLSAVDAPVAACISPPWCIGGVGGAGAGAIESLEVENPSMATRTVFVVVSEPADPASGETFTLSVSGASLPAALPGDTCATAIGIDAGTLATETTAGFYDNYVVPNTAQGCNGFTSVGRDRVYAIDVAPGQTLSATVTPAPSIDGGNNPDPALFLLGGPEACQPVIAACLAGSDVGLDGEPETAVYTNDGGTPVNVLILVDSYYTDPIPSFTLQTTLTP